jgi:two-component system sensor kinase FixL
LVRLDRTNRAPCRFEQIVNEALELCRPDLDRTRVTARTDIAADLPRVMVDLLQVEQVLINLLRNAIEAIGNTRGSILIAAKKIDADFVEIRVADTGPGFPPTLLESAFLPLSSSKAEGLGIGLPLCRSIVEAHGGKLWIDDGSQGGAVHFTLPIAKRAKL